MRGEIGFIIAEIKIVGDNHSLEEHLRTLSEKILNIIGEDGDHFHDMSGITIGRICCENACTIYEDSRRNK